MAAPHIRSVGSRRFLVLKTPKREQLQEVLDKSQIRKSNIIKDLKGDSWFLCLVVCSVWWFPMGGPQGWRGFPGGPRDDEEILRRRKTIALGRDLQPQVLLSVRSGAQPVAICILGWVQGGGSRGEGLGAGPEGEGAWRPNTDTAE